MTEGENSKQYDLEARTFVMAQRVRRFVKQLPRTVANVEDVKQLIRASGSVGANYIEANESLSKKDFVVRIKICRKEAKECRYWLHLLETGERQQVHEERELLVQEATELMKIFGSVMRKSM